jgi:hypothetical protein
MLSRLKAALWAMLRRSGVERELDAELRYQIEQLTEQNVRPRRIRRRRALLL